MLLFADDKRRGKAVIGLQAWRKCHVFIIIFFEVLSCERLEDLWK